MVWYCIFFFLICFFLIVQQNYTLKFKLSTPVIFLFVSILVILVVIRPSNLPDYIPYYKFYHGSLENGDRFEVTARIYRNISPSFHVFLFLYALTSVFLKLYSIKQNSSYHILSIITLISTSFLLHDFIQIRASCAIAIFLFSIKYLIEKKFLKYFLLICIACLYHKSSAVFFVLPIFSSHKFNTKFWISLIIISYFFAFLKLDLFSLIELILPNDNYVYILIKNLNEESHGVNVFNLEQLVKLSIVFYFIIYKNRLKNDKYIFLKIYILSIVILPVFSSLVVVAFRLAEMFNVVIVFLLPEIINISKNKKFGYYLFLFFCCCFFYINVISVHYFK